MSGQELAFKAKLLVYDLNNCAREYGFKEGEGWDFVLTSSKEKAKMESRYRPTVCTVVLPEIGGQLAGLIEEGLNQQKREVQKRLDEEPSLRPDSFYLVAYNSGRIR